MREKRACAKTDLARGGNTGQAGKDGAQRKIIGSILHEGPFVTKGGIKREKKS